MPLHVAFIGHATGERDPHTLLLEDALRARGDQVEVWSLPEVVGPFRALSTLAGLHRAHRAAPLDLLVWCGSTGFALLAGAIPRLRGAKNILELTKSGPYSALERVALHLADAAVARDPAGYQALLDAQLPAYRAQLVQDAPSPAHFAPRAAEPSAKERLELLVVVEDPAQLEGLPAAVAEVLKKQSKVRLRVLAPPAVHPAFSGALEPFGAERLQLGVLPADPAARAAAYAAAHLLVAVGVSGPHLREVSAIGLGTLVYPEETAPAAEVIGRVLKDPKLRAAAAERAVAKDQESGHPALLRAWLRLVDHLCKK